MFFGKRDVADVKNKGQPKNAQYKLYVKDGRCYADVVKNKPKMVWQPKRSEPKKKEVE